MQLNRLALQDLDSEVYDLKVLHLLDYDLLKNYDNLYLEFKNKS